MPLCSGGRLPRVHFCTQSCQPNVLFWTKGCQPSLQQGTSGLAALGQFWVYFLDQGLSALMTTRYLRAGCPGTFFYPRLPAPFTFLDQGLIVQITRWYFRACRLWPQWNTIFQLGEVADMACRFQTFRCYHILLKLTIVEMNWFCLEY